MKALSIRQPWAWLIVNGYKDVENRTWGTSVRGEVLIHAGKEWGVRPEDWGDVELFREELLPWGHPENIWRGGIVGRAKIVDCVQESDSRWFEGLYGFVLQDAQKLPFRPMKGRLGCFDVRDDLSVRCLDCGRLTGVMTESVETVFNEKPRRVEPVRPLRALPLLCCKCKRMRRYQHKLQYGGM